MPERELIFVLSFFIFALGAAIASFLNVVIWRVPRGESIVSPPSHCPKCLSPIRWYQNIPILAWLCLRGRCAVCHEPISPRYVLIEFLGGVLFLATFLRYGLSPFMIFALIWVSLMMVGSFIDYDHQLLPDFVTVGGMILGLIAAAVNDGCVIYFGVHPFVWYNSCMLRSLLGLVFGFGLLALIRFVGSKVFHREAMGLGDVFLMGAVGAMFGPMAVLVTLILSSVYGSIVGLGLIALAKTRLGRFLAIPFGPFICLACLTWMFWGAEIVTWYVNLLRLPS